MKLIFLVRTTLLKIVPRAETRTELEVICGTEVSWRSLGASEGTNSPLETRVQQNERRKVSESSEILDRENTGSFEIRYTASSGRADGRKSNGGDFRALPDDGNSFGELDKRVES